MLNAVTTPLAAGFKTAESQVTGFSTKIDVVANKVVAAEDKIAAHAKGAAAGAGGLGGNLKSGLLSVLGPIGAVVGGAFAIKKSFEAASEDQAALGKLNAVLNSTGNTTGFTSQQLQQLATDLQKTTNFADETTVAAEATLASFKHISGDQFKGAVIAAQDVSAAIGGDLQANIFTIGQILQNPIANMKKLKGLGVDVTDQFKAQVTAMANANNLAGAQNLILGQLQQKFGGTAQAVANPWTQIQNSIGDVSEAIGRILIPIVGSLAQIFIPVLNSIIGAIDSWGPQVSALFLEIFTTVGAVFSAFGDIAATVFNAIGGLFGMGGDSALTFGDVFNSVFQFVQRGVIGLEFFFTHWKDVLALAAVAAAYEIVSFANQVVYFFSQVLPAYIDWFGNHWKEVFTDILNLTSTIATNIFENLSNLWDGIVGLFSGDGFHFEWKPLTEGFKSAITELPKIAERELGPLEKGLQSQMDALAGKVGDDFSNFVEARTKGIATDAASIRDKLSKGLGAFAGNAIGGGGPGAGGVGDSLAAGGEKLGALVRGSKEAFKAEHGGQSGFDKLNATAEKQLTAIEQVADNTKPDNTDADVVDDL